MKLSWRRLLGGQLAWLFRITLGVVFIVASIDKIADPTAFAASIANYRMAPQGLINAMAICLPWIELFCGCCLVFGLWSRGNLLVVDLLLALFIVAISSALRRGLDISCGCFTTDPNAHGMTLRTLYWDIIWLAMGLHALLLDRNLLSVTLLLRRRPHEGDTP